MRAKGAVSIMDLQIGLYVDLFLRCGNGWPRGYQPDDDLDST